MAEDLWITLEFVYELRKITGTKVGKILIMEDAELKTSVDVISLIDNSNVSMSSMSEAEVSESKHGCTSPEMREISALISFKGTGGVRLKCYTST